MKKFRSYLTDFYENQKNFILGKLCQQDVKKIVPSIKMFKNLI